MFSHSKVVAGCVLRASLCAAMVVAIACGAAADEPVDYLRDVKPILAKSCFRCHGPDEQKSGLRLDAVATAREGGYSGPAIEPGKSDESLLIKAVRGADDVPAMPPDGEGPRLSPQQIAAIARWIDTGAKAPADDRPGEAKRRSSDHWAFQPVKRPAVPEVAATDRIRNPIDSFIQARLAKEKLAPSPEADRVTQLRRLSLDLLGLPPTVAQVEEFLADQGPEAYERLVDRLLASPHYGERWGRHWLDLARYADSNGYTNDNPRSIWKYRDWVIDALNRDLPFDRFTIEQMAGDLLPEPTVDQLVATGFHRNTLLQEEGGTDREEFRIESVVDRVATTGTVFLGLTLGCARCHDHKFDPISQRDFYRMFALLNNADEPTLSLPAEEQKARFAELTAAADAAQASLAQFESEHASERGDWEQAVAAVPAVKWTVLDPVEFRSEGGATLTKLDDRSLLAGGERVARDTYVVTAQLPFANVTAVRVEALTDDSLPKRGPGRAKNGNFVLSELKAELVDEATGTVEHPAWAWATADHSQDRFAAEYLVDGNEETGWAINVDAGSLNVDRKAICATRDDLPGGRKIVLTLAHRHKDPDYVLGRFRISVTAGPREGVRYPEAVREAAGLPAEKRTAEVQALLTAFYMTTASPEYKTLYGRMQASRQELNSFGSKFPSTLVMRERKQPRETHLLVRGEYLHNGPVVPPGVPEVLPPLSTDAKQPNRLDLARWLVDPANPLVARVTVNRVWQQYFGRGLVETSNDFGVQSSGPTHPELLDWLASEFVAQKWSLKALHRLIVASATYRQASHARAELAGVDADNKLLARQSRLRVEAEIVRDLALASSGLLSPKIGGPSVFPPQPDGVMALTRSVRKWEPSQGEDRYRRGMYTHFWRSTPHPFLRVFDAPDGNTTCTRRDRANTPLQALTLLNDEACIEAARALAARVTAEAPSADAAARIRYAFRLCLAREPSDSERACLAELLADELAEAPPEGQSAEQHVAAAWTSVARAILNVDEFVTRE